MQKAFVKILAGGKVFGNGFLVEGGYIVTCAHVVRKALNTKTTAIPEMRSGELAAVFHWHKEKIEIPLSLESEGFEYDGKGDDIAILSLSTEVPGVSGLRLANTPKERFKAWAKPYISALNSSAKIECTVDEMDEYGRLILSATTGYKQFVELGCSGAPVFAENGELVEAMIAVSDTAVRQAFAITAQRINLRLSILMRATRSLKSSVAQASRAAPQKSLDNVVGEGAILSKNGADKSDQGNSELNLQNHSAKLFVILWRLQY